MSQRNTLRWLRGISPLDARLLLFGGLVILASRLAAEEKPEAKLPQITRVTPSGEREVLGKEYGELTEYEKELQKRMRGFNAPDEVFALEKAYQWGTQWAMELAIRGERAEVRWYIPIDRMDRYFSREISQSELAAFRRQLAADRVEQLPPPPSNICDGVWYYYTHLTKTHGRQWYINNPPYLPGDRPALDFPPLPPRFKERQAPPGPSAVPTRWDGRPVEPNDPYMPAVRLMQEFAKLCDPDKMQLHYVLPEPLPELEVLYANPLMAIRAVWKKGDDIRVRVKHDWRPHRAGASDFPFYWYQFSDGKLHQEVEQPPAYPRDAFKTYGQFPSWEDPAEQQAEDLEDLVEMDEYLGRPVFRLKDQGRLSETDESFSRPVLRFDDHCRSWQAQMGERSIRGGRLASRGGLFMSFMFGPPPTDGTWILGPGERMEKLFDQIIRHQVVTPDGRWLVGTLSEKLICYDLERRKTIPIKDEDGQAVDGLFAIRNWPGSNEVLLMRPAAWPWPSDKLRPQPDFYLLNPATGEVAWPFEWPAEFGRPGSTFRSTGEPWLQHTNRPLQSTSEEGVFWAAIPDREGPFTRVGRYQGFDFVGTFWVYPLVFESGDMWVDEEEEKIYLVYKNDLLRLPLHVSLLRSLERQSSFGVGGLPYPDGMQPAVAGEEGQE